MAATIDVQIDEENQIIVQSILGDVGQGDLVRLFELTEACVARLRDPSRVRILANMPVVGKPDAPTRRFMIRLLARPEPYKTAVYNAGPMTRAVAAFLRVAAGNRKMAAFGAEAEARAWLDKD